MDKIAANNHFVLLMKDVKKAKAMAGGNLIRKLKQLKDDKEKADDLKSSKLDAKINCLCEEIKLMKTLDPYTVAKKATLNPDPKFWAKVIHDSKASAEERLTARVISKNNIHRQVNKFRSDHKDCDEWLNEYIEFREKKKSLQDSTQHIKNYDKPRLDKRSKGGNAKRSSDNNTKSDAPKRLSKREIATKQEMDQICESNNDSEGLHPSWICKKIEKKLMREALSGKIDQPKRIKFDDG